MRAIDLFAGAGGFTSGATAAGARVVWAANHWQLAVETHSMNHPATEHSCRDLLGDDWCPDVPGFDLLLASPCCQGHSRAKGKPQPHHDRSRATAWAVVSCAEYHEPAVCVIENVAEFKTWKLFGAWRWAMEALGYVLTEQVIDSADCGVAQHRPRLILVASRHGAIEIPKPDRPHRSARDILDLEGGKWSPVDKPGRSPATLARVARGRIDVGDEFVMPYYSSGSGLTGRSLDRPIGAITCKDRWALVRGDRMRMLSVDEYRKAMGFGAEYQLPRVAKKRAVRLLGNAICPPVAEHCVRAVLNHFS